MPSDAYIPMNLYPFLPESFTSGNYNLAQLKMLLKQAQHLLDPQS